MTITFCGHASFVARKEYEERMMSILEELIGDGAAELYLGGYGGFDDFAYACAHKYKKINPKVELIYVTPYITEQFQKTHLEEKAEKYDKIIYPAIENIPLRFAIVYRNRYMVDVSEHLICYIKHEWGGAYKAYSYARRKGKSIINLCTDGGY